MSDTLSSCRIHLAMSCSELYIYFSRHCALNRTGTFGSESNVMFLLTDFAKWYWNVSFLTSICVNNCFETVKSWFFFNKVTSSTFRLLDFVKSRILCLLLSQSTTHWDISSIFSFFLFYTCSMPRQDFTVPFHFPSGIKYYLNS